MPITQQGVPPTALDGTPPVPQLQPQGLTGLVQPQQAPVLPPQVLTGMMQVAADLGNQLDQLAGMTKDVMPKTAQGFGLVKDLLQKVMADLMIAGSGPTSPQAPGGSFPGGAFDLGQSAGG